MSENNAIKVAFMIPALGELRRGVEAQVTNLALELATDFGVTIFSRKKVLPICQSCWAISHNHLWLRRLDNIMPAFIKKRIGRYFNNWMMEAECFSFSLCLLPKLLWQKYNVFIPVSIWGMLIATIVRRLKGTRIIYINHGGAEKIIAGLKPDRLVVLTPDIQEWVRKHNPKLKISLIPFGPSLKRFSPRVKPVKLTMPRPRYICVAGLTAYKRIDLTIRATAKLTKGSLVVLGQGELKNELQSLGYKLLGKKRFILTSVPYEKIPAYYRAADVFTVASGLGEAYGMVILEAMACGLPVVVNNDLRKHFLVEKAGRLVEVTDVNEYSRVLREVAEADYGNLPRKQAAKFAGEAKKYKQLIRELLK